MGARRRFVLSVAIVACAGIARAQQASAIYEARLVALNSSGVTGRAFMQLTANGNIAVMVEARGVEAGKAHLQIIHALPGKTATCPTLAAATDGTHLVTNDLGQPVYGAPAIQLPPQQPTGTSYLFAQTVSVTSLGLSVNQVPSPLGTTVVIHGMTVDGTYVATLPVACGVITTFAGAPAIPTTPTAPTTPTTPTTPTAPQAAPTITISGFAFSPQNLNAAPGATVTVVNKDPTPHSVTSESAPGAFTPGAVGGVQFDTGPFTGQRTFTIPASAQPGTVVPYFCTVHRQGMANTGQITITAP